MMGVMRHINIDPGAFIKRLGRHTFQNFHVDFRGQEP